MAGEIIRELADGSIVSDIRGLAVEVTVTQDGAFIDAHQIEIAELSA